MRLQNCVNLIWNVLHENNAIMWEKFLTENKLVWCGFRILRRENEERQRDKSRQTAGIELNLSLAAVNAQFLLLFVRHKMWLRPNATRQRQQLSFCIEKCRIPLCYAFPRDVHLLSLYFLLVFSVLLHYIAIAIYYFALYIVEYYLLKIFYFLSSSPLDFLTEHCISLLPFPDSWAEK